MAYRVDLREKVMLFIDSGGSTSEAAEIFNIRQSTLYTWINLRKETGALEPRPHGGGFQSKVEDPEEFKRYIEENPDKTLEEIGEYFGMSYGGAFYNLKKYGYSYKKNSSLQGAKRRKEAKISGRDKQNQG